MYNGIGLTTVRGSATSGYVQRNLGHVRPKQARERAHFGQRHRDNWENNKSARKANPEILDHQRKRRMEVKLMELRVAMEDRGYKEEEIEMKVTELRNKISAEQASQATENASRLARGSRDTHERAVHKDHENERFRRAFRVDEDHRPGDSFDPAVQARRREERKRKYEERELQRSEREMQHNERRKLQMEKKDDPKSLEDVTTQRHNREPKDALEKSGNASQESKQSERNIDVDDKDNVSGKHNTKRDSRRHRRNRQRGRSSSSDSSSSSSGSSSSSDSSSSSSGVSDTENKQRRGRSRRRESSNRGREKEESTRHRERHSGRGGRARRSADERDTKSVSKDKVNRRASRSTSREVNRRASRSPSREVNQRASRSTSREVNRRASRSTSREVNRRASRSTSREGDRAGSSQHKKLRKTDDGNTSTKSLSCEDQQGRRQRKRSVSPHEPRRDDTHSSSKRSKRD